MDDMERLDAVIVGSGNGGMYLAWHLARSGRRTAVVERRWIRGSCPNINRLPSKNEIFSAKVADVLHHSEMISNRACFVSIDMVKVRQRKRKMVDQMIAGTLKEYASSGAELIMGSGHFVAPRTLGVDLNDGGTRVLVGDQVFLNLETHAAIPDVPGLYSAGPLTVTHVAGGVC